MKIAVTCSVLALLSLGTVSIGRADSSSADTVKTITALEMKWAKAEANNKSAEIEPLLADNLIATESEGQVLDKASFMADERATLYSSSSITDLKVIAHGNTAIANYVLSQKFTSGGKAVDRQVRETDTWVKMPSGAWQCVALHGTIIAKS